jgi:hypothetical protein
MSDSIKQNRLDMVVINLYPFLFLLLSYKFQTNNFKINNKKIFCKAVSQSLNANLLIGGDEEVEDFFESVNDIFPEEELKNILSTTLTSLQSTLSNDFNDIFQASNVHHLLQEKGNPKEAINKPLQNIVENTRKEETKELQKEIENIENDLKQVFLLKKNIYVAIENEIKVANNLYNLFGIN